MNTEKAARVHKSLWTFLRILKKVETHSTKTKIKANEEEAKTESAEKKSGSNRKKRTIYQVIGKVHKMWFHLFCQHCVWCWLLMNSAYAKIDSCLTKHVFVFMFSCCFYNHFMPQHLKSVESIIAFDVEHCSLSFYYSIFLFYVVRFFFQNGRVVFVCMWFQGIWHITGQKITGTLFVLTPCVIQSYTHGYSRPAQIILPIVLPR